MVRHVHVLVTMCGVNSCALITVLLLRENSKVHTLFVANFHLIRSSTLSTTDLNRSRRQHYRIAAWFACVKGRRR